MPEQFNWTLNVQVVAGPKVSTSGAVEVEAYDKLQILVSAGETDKEVEVQPGTPGQVQFLLISASQYSSDLTYKVNDATADAVALDALHLFMGTGAVALLDPQPTTLFFTNNLAADVTVQILVGRDAAP